MPTVRYPIGELRHVGAGTPVRVGARVTGVDGARAMLVDATGSVEAHGETPPLGAWVLADGTWTGRFVESARYEVASTAAAPFPAQQGEWVRLHDRGVLQALHARAGAARAVRRWFDERAFLEVETPLAVPSPGLDLHLSAIEAVGLRERRWLITSPEYQMKRLLAGGLARIYQIAKCFRRGEEGALHEPEFTML